MKAKGCIQRHCCMILFTASPWKDINPKFADEVNLTEKDKLSEMTNKDNTIGAYSRLPRHDTGYLANMSNVDVNRRLKPSQTLSLLHLSVGQRISCF